MTYRIITDKGTVDFAVDIEAAKRRFRYYEEQKNRGYFNWVKIIGVDTFTQEEITIKENDDERNRGII